MAKCLRRNSPVSRRLLAKRFWLRFQVAWLRQIGGTVLLRRGRSTWRRMNRYEYENTLRDILGAPWLQVKEMLPEDGEAYRYNKIGEALDVSHVHMSQYLSAAEYALREVLPKSTTRPQATTKRYYARQSGAIAGKIRYPKTNERDAYPVMGTVADVAVLKKTAPVTVGPSQPEKRELGRRGSGLQFL